MEAMETLVALSRRGGNRDEVRDDEDDGAPFQLRHGPDVSGLRGRLVAEARDAVPRDDHAAYSHFPIKMIANYVGRARTAVVQTLQREGTDPLDDDDYVAALVDETLGGARRFAESWHYVKPTIRKLSAETRRGPPLAHQLIVRFREEAENFERWECDALLTLESALLTMHEMTEHYTFQRRESTRKLLVVDEAVRLARGLTFEAHPPSKPDN
jgi:hypothetical protein